MQFRTLCLALAVSIASPQPPAETWHATPLRSYLWASSTSLSSPSSQENSFADRNATALLGEIAAGLTAHNPERMLGAFDLNKMSDGPAFKQQVIALFSQTTLLLIHFNQVHTSMEDGRGVATTEVEVEARFGDEWIPPLYKQAQLHLVAEMSGGKWKFTDVQPRTFFSTQP